MSGHSLTTIHLRVQNTSRKRSSNSARPSSKCLADNLKLDRVLGLTLTSSAALSSESQGLIAYPAGCTVVFYSAQDGKQFHIINPSKKTITCLSFSADGKYLATGEGGHDPQVRVWNVQERAQVMELTAHKFAISCVCFDPKGNYLVSIGEQHDQLVCVWDWKKGTKQASNKISSKVQAVRFAENGQYFVTVGHRSVKYWYLERSRPSPVPKYGSDVAVIKGRSAILGDHRYNMFMDVVCGKGDLADRTYCVTQKGVLCEFDSRRMLAKWVDLQTKCASSLCWGSGNLFVACADGTVRVFVADGFKFIATLPAPHHLGVDVAKGQSSDALIHHPSKAVFPDTVALCYSENVKRITCVYDDHSLYQWDVRSFDRMGLVASHMYHSGCVWDVECYPLVLAGPNPSHPILTPNTFITCGSDETIRVWNCDHNQDVCYSDSSHGLYARSIFSKEMVKIIYLGDDLKGLKDSDVKSGDKSDQYDGSTGVRCIRVSPDGQSLASGDRSGNVRVHDLNTLKLIANEQAHDSMVTCLQYTDYQHGIRGLNNGPYLLASGSRDRILHIYDADNAYEPVDNIDDHTATITAVKFVNENGSMHMLSCGADKSIVYRELQTDPEFKFIRSNQVAAQTTIYDMQIDPVHKCALTACQDRQIRMYDLAQGKYRDSLRGTLGDDGNLIKLQVDPSCQFIATSCTDKTVCLIDLKNGEMVAAVSGHSEYVTGIVFTPDCTRLITVSGDGCIFIWKLSDELSKCMIRNLPQNYLIPHHIIESGGNDDLSGDTEMIENDSLPDNITASNPLFDKPQAPIRERPPKPPKPRKMWGEMVTSPLTVVNPNDTEIGGREEECFLGAGSVSTIRRKFEIDSLGKSPISNIRQTRGMADGSSDPASPPGNPNSSPDIPDLYSTANKPATQIQVNGASQSIIFVNSPSYETGNFEVKERTEMLKNSQPRYARTDTLGNDLSDEEENNMSASPSFQNLRGGLDQSTEVLHPRRHWEVKDAFDITRAVPEATDESFSRRNPARRSLTQRAQSGESRPRWGPPVDLNKRPSPLLPSPIPMHSTPISSNPFKFNDRGRSTNTNGSPTWSPDKVEMRSAQYTQGRLNPARKSYIDENYTPSPVTPLQAAQMRAKRPSFARDKNRRLTLPSHMFFQDNYNRDDEYGSSDLHMRSKSPAQYHSALKRRDSNSSDVSFASNTSRVRTFGGMGGMGRPGALPSPMDEARGIQGSLSMSALHHATTSNGIASHNNSVVTTNRRLSDIREKLRKSHENLALGPEAAEILNSESALSGLSRSKSYGALNNPEQAIRPISRTGYSALASARTKSVGCLRDEQKGLRGQRSLADSIRDLKNISNSDIDKAGVDTPNTSLASQNDTLNSTGQDGPSFYERSSTMPRQRPKGAVLKKIETRQKYIDRASASGDSDSASDANTSRYNPRNRHNASYNRRLNNTNESEIYGTPVRPNTSSFTVASQKPTPPLPKPNRGTNYLAHKLMPGPDTEQGPELTHDNTSFPSTDVSLQNSKIRQNTHVFR